MACRLPDAAVSFYAQSGARDTCCAGSLRQAKTLAFRGDQGWARPWGRAWSVLAGRVPPLPFPVPGPVVTPSPPVPVLPVLRVLPKLPLAGLPLAFSVKSVGSEFSVYTHVVNRPADSWQGWMTPLAMEDDVMKAKTGLLLCLVLGLGACSQRQEAPSDFGEAMQDRGTMNKEVGDQWQKGNEKVQRGSRMIEESKQDAAEGQRLIREGRSEMRSAEEQGRLQREQPIMPGAAPSAPPAPQY